MSNEGVNNNTSNGSNLAMYAAMPTITLGISATHGVVKARGVSKALKLQNHSGFKKLANSLEGDVFTKSIKIAEEYEKHKGIVKTYNKWNNKLVGIAKANGVSNEVIKNSTTEELIEIVKKGNFEKVGKADSFFNWIKSPFGKSKTSVANVVENAGDATSALRKADNALDTIGDAAKAAKVGAEATKLGFGESVKKLFHREMTSKFNIVLTALTFIPNVINRVIPAFKEEGFAAGMKETGKVLVQGVTDFFSYAAGGALGRTIGGAIGSIFPGVGTVVGATLGDMLGSMIVGGKITKTVEKAIGADEATEEKLKEQREAKKLAQSQFGLNVSSNPYVRAQAQSNTRMNFRA